MLENVLASGGIELTAEEEATVRDGTCFRCGEQLNPPHREGECESRFCNGCSTMVLLRRKQ